ncbi:Hypothetical predicted protein [Olea europaea subsp. europaea]|uniref:Uncharacterized protein n=1 Tax=Olea europaea subsp. europaea TaxID=158383 RepID=A0A8S0T293_OLEEU|nr:Hypothetical predicted protein [Olea europaea subsp. europaea]
MAEEGQTRSTPHHTVVTLPPLYTTKRKQHPHASTLHHREKHKVVDKLDRSGPPGELLTRVKSGEGSGDLPRILLRLLPLLQSHRIGAEAGHPVVQVGPLGPDHLDHRPGPCEPDRPPGGVLGFGFGFGLRVGVFDASFGECGADQAWDVGMWK